MRSLSAKAPLPGPRERLWVHPVALEVNDGVVVHLDRHVHDMSALAALGRLHSSGQLAQIGHNAIDLRKIGSPGAVGRRFYKGQSFVHGSGARTDKGLRVVPGPLSQQRIADRLGASKAMVNRLLTDLARGGYIEVSRERIVLLKKLPPKW